MVHFKRLLAKIGVDLTNFGGHLVIVKTIFVSNNVEFSSANGKILHCEKDCRIWEGGGVEC